MDKANSFCDFTLDEAERGIDAGVGIIVESTGRSWLWEFDKAEHLTDQGKWKLHRYAACAHMGVRSKKQIMASNIDELECIESECHHTHDPREWDPYESQDGVWVYPGSEEAEYTAHLVYAIAI